MTLGKDFWLRLLAVLAPTLILVPFIAAHPAAQDDRRPHIKPGPRDKCPVCGMFVAKYPDFLAEILFEDGTYALFDGTKDMFRFYFDPDKYQTGKSRSDIDAIYVTDYYDLSLIEGYTAYYVTGSDIYGPMGAELIPFKTEEDAKTFASDHKGERILKFRDVTPELIEDMD